MDSLFSSLLLLPEDYGEELERSGKGADRGGLCKYRWRSTFYPLTALPYVILP